MWHFCPAKSKNKIEQIQKRDLKFLSENENLFFEPGNSSMEVKRLRKLALEIYKTLNSINPSYMKQIFCKPINRTSERFRYNIESKSFNQVKYGKNSLRVLGQILWNSLPNFVKSQTSLEKFKIFINSWGNYGCPLYKKFISYLNAVR